MKLDAARYCGLSVCLLSTLALAADPMPPAPPPPSAGEVFQTLDIDDDKQLVAAEFLALSSHHDRIALQQRFRAFDHDRNEVLSLAEFLSIYDLIPGTPRGSVPDPLADWAEAQVHRILEKLPVPTPIANLADQWAKVLPSSMPLTPQLWDRNQDQQVDREEAELGLRISYGLLRQDGRPARWKTGFVFNGSYFQHLDRNHDEALTQQEFVSEYYAGPEVARKLFLAADANHDDRLSLAEIDAAQLLRTDVPATFLDWDRNRDGTLDETELQLGATWQRNVASHLLPGFDLDGDHRLSLSEFQQCPLGNPLLNWTTVPTDRSADGLLDLSEFSPGADLFCHSVAALFFSRFDLNQNQQLELNEYRFLVDESQLSEGRFLALRDQDGDQLLAPLELWTPLGHAPKQEDRADLIPQHLHVFEAADSNHDGRISVKEFRADPEFPRIARLERELRRIILPKFGALDQDRDGTVSADEWLFACPQSLLAGRKQDFLISDFDGNGQLNFAEFASLPLVCPVELRPLVRDPVWEEIERLQASILKQLPATGEIAASALVTIIAPLVNEFSEADLIGWDRNSDGRFQRAEIQTGLDIFYALRTVGGQSVRRRNGQVLNLRAVFNADRDQNSQLSQQEFLASFWKQGAAAIADFQHADTDGNLELTLAEIHQSELYWLDTQAEFRRFDADQNGQLSAEELAKKAYQFEARMARSVLPAFDLNGDGQLTFMEFRLTPLANPMHDYHARRWDLDLDGSLSLMEFHRGTSGTRAACGLSEIFFARLDRDRNQQLSFAEFNFTADLKNEPVDVVFQILDVDSDNQLLLEELLPRERPKDQSAWAKRHSEQRAMEVEDAFHATDADQNQGVSLEEFKAEKSKIRSAILRTDPRRKPSREAVAAVPKSEEATGSWRLMALIGVNICLFIGFGWWRYRN